MALALAHDHFQKKPDPKHGHKHKNQENDVCFLFARGGHHQGDLLIRQSLSAGCAATRPWDSVFPRSMLFATYTQAVTQREQCYGYMGTAALRVVAWFSQLHVSRSWRAPFLLAWHVSVTSVDCSLL